MPAANRCARECFCVEVVGFGFIIFSSLLDGGEVSALSLVNYTPAVLHQHIVKKKLHSK